MTDLKLSTRTLADTRADTVVVLADGGCDPMRLVVPAAAMTSEESAALLSAAAAVMPKPKDPVRLPGAVIGRTGVVVLAPVTTPDDLEAVRRAVGAALRGVTAGTVAVVAPGTDPALLSAVAEGAILGAYRFDRYRSTASDSAPSRLRVLVPGSISKAMRHAVAESAVVTAAVVFTRDLVNTPPSDLGPEDLAAVAAGQCSDVDVAVKVWDDSALRRGGFGGLTAVGQGSARGPRLVRLRYRPERARAHVALVGKGITFDSGGLSLKPAQAMETMKSDMAGAAAVLATVVTAARLGLPIAVTGWMALAENMPSGTAQRPGDVITINNGTTVEVLNTDAEGRLVLADALVMAAAEQPDAIVDIATLTGAQMIALGSHVAGAMGNDDAFREQVVAAAGQAGELVWPMPLPDQLRASLDSTVADLKNIGDRNGGMLTAALFLREFVPADIAWAHLDIAGPSFNEGAPHGYTPKGGTGFGVRTLLELLRRRAAR